MRNIHFHALVPDLMSKTRKEQAEWSGDKLRVQKLKMHKWGTTDSSHLYILNLEGNKTAVKDV
jgi:hypothetical protein